MKPEEPVRLGPKAETIKFLFLRSGNQCAFPRCNNEIYNLKNKLIAECCHIEAALPGGERFNPSSTNEQRRSYENLLFLCHEHHVETDDVSTYTVDALKKMKADHEAQYNSVADQPVDDIVKQVLDSFKGQLNEIEDIVNEIKDNQSKLLTFLSSEKGKSETISLGKPKMPELEQKLSTSSNNDFSSLLKEILLSSIPKQLRSIRINGVHGVDKAISVLCSKPILAKEMLKSSDFNDDLNTLRSISSRYGSGNFGVSSDRSHLYKSLKDPNFQVNIAFTPIMLATSAIFFHLKYVRGLNINLDYSFVHAIELAERIIDKSVQKIHACVLGDAPSLRLIQNANPRFQFVSFMPRVEQKIVTTSSISNEPFDLSKGEYIFIGDKVSTTLIHFENWKDKGIIDKRKTDIKSVEPHESAEFLLDGDPDKRLLVWSPYWQMYQRLGIGVVQDTSDSDCYFFDSLLFFQKSFSKYQKRKSKALQIAIRDSWFSLMDPDVLNEVVALMINEPAYVSNLRRFLDYDSLKDR